PSVHSALRIELTGRLSVPALTAALDQLVRRHPALRTRLVERGGELVQEVLAHRPLTVGVTDVAASGVERWAVETGRVAFDDSGPLLRAALARVDDERWSLLVVIHHLAADGWSMLRLVEELGETYPAALAGRPPRLEPVEASYADYARHQRATPPDPEVLGYWRRQLAGAPGELLLPTDRPRPARSRRGTEASFVVPADVTARLVALAKGAKTTLFPVVAAGYAVLLARLAGVDEIVLGCPYAHRAGRAHESVVGLFAAVMPVRLPVRPSASFTELVLAADATILDAVRHQPAHMAQINREIDPDWRPGRPPPVAPSVFAWNPAMPELALPGLTARLVDQPLDCARRDLVTVLRPDGDTLVGAVEYATDLFDADTVADWCDRYVRLLDVAGRDPDRPLGPG
ncbi:MAG TPA: condensation domain-containing protein, partial [Micromonospora sp.]